MEPTQKLEYSIQEVDSDGWTKLHHAADQVDLGRVCTLLATNPDVNLPTETTLETALHLATGKSQWHDDVDRLVQIVKLLAEHGADLNAHDHENRTALHHLARRGGPKALAVARVLTELGADVNVNCFIGDREAHYRHGMADRHSCTCGAHIEKIVSKVTGEPEVKQRRPKYEGDAVPLHFAVQAGDLPMVKLLVESGAKVDVLDRDLGTPLHCAAYLPDAEICKFLMEQEGARWCLDKSDRYGRTPISNAAESDKPHADIAKILLEAGSKVDFIIAEGSFRSGGTPLGLALDQKQVNPDMIRLFLEHGASPTNHGAKSEPIIVKALKSGIVRVVKMLLEKGATFDVLIEQGILPLHVAASKGHGALCKWLVKECGADVNQVSPDGEDYTALILASGYADSAYAVDVLAKLGANVHAKTHDGRTALHFAAFKGRLGSARALLRHGTDVECVDENEWTPLHFAGRYHHLELIKLLLGAGAKVGKKVVGGPSPKRADGEEISVEGFTAADLAKVVRGGEEVVGLLLAAGDELSLETRDLKDEDLWEEKPMQMQCPQQ